MRPEPARPAPPPPKLASKKRILILGGTGFLGPKTVAAALARGHERRARRYLVHHRVSTSR